MHKFQIAYKSIFRLMFLFLSASYVSLFFISCTTTKKNVLYFENLPGDTILHNLVTKDFELKIRKEDILNIGVSSLSSENSALFTAPQGAAGAGATAIAGYTVDTNGNILYPKLGFIHVEGMTRAELRDHLLKD